jgi:hypothetical protein
VETLAGELEAEKIEPWLCEVDIELGDNFVAKIEEGLSDADLTVLFWSPEAARSDWTRLEWTAVTVSARSPNRGPAWASCCCATARYRNCSVLNTGLTPGPTPKKANWRPWRG